MDNNEVVRIFRGVKVDAVYSDHLVPQYKDHPFIEALPKIKDRKELYEALRLDIPYEDALRELPAEVRLHMAFQCRRFFKPYEQVISLGSILCVSLMDAYVTRNPIDPNYFPKPENDAPGKHGMKYPQLRPQPKQSPTLTIIGVSGGGKSYSSEANLYLFPQVIIHREFQGRPFPFQQVVWLKINCPPNGTVRGLCFRILIELDELVGTDYYRIYGENGDASRDQLTTAIGIVIRNHGIGCIVIDEIQTLIDVKEGDRDEAINFFMDLENMEGVCIIKIGTYKAQKLFKEFRQGRRAIGGVPVYWNAMKNDEEWKAFVKALWKYQYTRSLCPLDDALIDLLYEISQGILDIAVKVFIFSQFRAIANGGKAEDEKITPDLLKSIDRDYLKPVRPMLEALKKNDIYALAKFEDIHVDMENTTGTLSPRWLTRQASLLGLSPIQMRTNQSLEMHPNPFIPFRLRKR